MLLDIALIKPTVIVMEKHLLNPKSSRIQQNIRRNYHKILCKAQIITVELVYPCMWYANSQCSAKSTCITASLLMTSNVACLL